MRVRVCVCERTLKYRLQLSRTKKAISALMNAAAAFFAFAFFSFLFDSLRMHGMFELGVRGAAPWDA